jgi:EAL domain-containing protein (putative c-di-GMP-specific phosphodiesterase class I)
MADVRMTATKRAWLSWGGSGEGVEQRRVRSPISPRHPAAGWLAGELERAAAPAGLELVYQPIFDLESERVVGIEALPRLVQVPGLPADCWLPQAAAIGLSTAIELSLIRRVLVDLPRVPPSIQVAIKLSATAACDLRVMQLLRTAGPDAGRLVIQVAGDGRTGWPALEAPVARFRRLGLRIALDDSSLREMPALLPDIVKLEPTVVRSIDADPLRQALASTLALLAVDLGAIVCAEEVETADELQTLRQLGINHGQGTYLASPAPLPWTIGALVGHPSAAAVFS